MVYNKQTWQNNPPSTATPISADRLNHLETQYDEAIAALEPTVSEVESLSDTVNTGRLSETGLNATIAEALVGVGGGAPSTAPLYVSTIELGGSRNAAPGARTGLPATAHSVVAGDGVADPQGFTVERIATGVSGAAGAYTLTVTDTTSLAVLDGDGTKVWDAAVENGDGRAFMVTVLDVSDSTVTVLQPLPFAVSAGRLASRIDNVLGQHLTTIATKALAQHIAAADPVVGSRGAIMGGQWDTTPAVARPVWVRNAALVAYGSLNVNNVVSNIFDQTAANVYDTADLYRRPNTNPGGIVVGSHLSGHGATTTTRTGGRLAVIEFYTAARVDSSVVPSARVKVTATTPDGFVIYNRTVSGGMATHQIPALGVDAVTLDVTSASSGEFYIEASQLTVREAGQGAPLRPGKALLLGDSWSQFYGFLFGTALADALGCPVATFGKGGTTTDWGIAWLDTALAANPGVDTVIVHFYTNDLNNNQSTTMTLPDGSSAPMWPNGLTSAQARARWRAQINRLVSLIQQRGLRPVVIKPGMVNVNNQFSGHINAELPPLVDWAAGTAEFTNAASYLNTVGKKVGLVVLDTTLGKPLWATGATATSVWKDATGATVHTPA